MDKPSGLRKWIRRGLIALAVLAVVGVIVVAFWIRGLAAVDRRTRWLWASLAATGIILALGSIPADNHGKAHLTYADPSYFFNLDI